MLRRRSSLDQKIGLLKEEEAAMSESAKSEWRGKAASQGQLWLRLPDLVRDALYETMIGAGLAHQARQRAFWRALKSSSNVMISGLVLWRDCLVVSAA
jgi:hypothetical protein